MPESNLAQKLWGKTKPLREKLADLDDFFTGEESVDMSNPDKIIATSKPNIFERLGGERTTVKETDTTQDSGNITDSTRGISFSRDEVENVLKPMIYSEISSHTERPEEKVKLEAETVSNTVFNRMKNRDKSLTDVVMEPNQYQGVNTPMFDRYKTDNDDVSKKQIELVDVFVDEVLEKIQSGDQQDNVTGAEFYGHMKDGTIQAFDTWDEYKEAIDDGLVK